MSTSTYASRPNYDLGDRSMLGDRRTRAGDFARQVLDTAQPYLPLPVNELSVLDVGCGYGYTSLELAHRCGSVVGIEPSANLFEHAANLASASGLENLEYRFQSIEKLGDTACYDLVLLDNVLEHFSDQPTALRNICRSLKPKGVMLIIVPNKLWPIEAHYGLPFLSYLPLSLANVYLRLSGQGTDYTDASYAPTYFGLNRLLSARQELSYQYVLPADLSLTTLRNALHYRLGAAALRYCPWLWPISKVFMVIAVKSEAGVGSDYISSEI